MGWRELQSWLRATNRMIEREIAAQRGGPTDPDSWDGVGHDPWWAEQRAKQRRMRGR